jgi:hypothetical protein
MTPVGADILHKNRDEKLRPPRPHRDPVLQRRVDEKPGPVGEQDEREEQQEFPDGAGDEEVREVSPHARPPPEIAPDERKQRLQRHEDREQHEQRDGELREVEEAGHGQSDAGFTGTVSGGTREPGFSGSGIVCLVIASPAQPGVAIQLLSFAE